MFALRSDSSKVFTFIFGKFYYILLHNPSSLIYYEWYIIYTLRPYIIDVTLEDNVNHHEILIGIMNLREKLSLISLLEIKNFIKMCQQEDIIKLKNEAKKLNENVRNIKIPPTSHKIPPHFRIPW